MCGIAGILKFKPGTQVDSESLRQMCSAIVHRGPDDEGIYVEGPVGLGMRRLSIIDLATGHQPISNEDGTIWIVFNGEIYNHAALRDWLTARGHRFSTRSDTEVIVHLYEEYGNDCVQHLRGMFAFAAWDTRTRRLFLARDRMGIKPLYYRVSSGSFLFGSELKAILAYPGERAELNRAGLPEYLAFGYLSGPETFYAGIRKLMPGHWLEVDEHGSLRVEPYWDLVVAKEEERDESYYVNGYRDLLGQAVKSHLMSDVPLGVFLSGGVDSSAVAALMTNIRGTPVESFSVGYKEQAFSELSYARLVARHLKSVHHEVLVGWQDFFGSLPKLIWHEDEPLVWPSSVALYFVARLAREHGITVVLTGEGSDETLAGYTRYAFTLKNLACDRIYRHLTPEVFRHGIRRSVANSRWISAGLRRKLAHTFLAKDGDSWASFYCDNFFSAFAGPEQADLFTNEVACELGGDTPYRNVLKYWECSSGDTFQRLLYTDIKTYLVELLMKQDNMSMAASIESRVPFLDHELVEFAARIPQRVQIRGMAGKRVLKKAMAGLLPDAILHRKKLGFPTPWSGWLWGPELNAVQNLLSERRSHARRLFKPAAVEQLFQEHRARYRDHGDRIWRLLNLELWHRVCLEGESHDATPTERQRENLVSSSTTGLQV